MTVTSYSAIYRVVRRIPLGRVTTYGTIATLAGIPNQARLVGYALSALPGESSVPWHRVVNATGRVSISDSKGGATTQLLRLACEGVDVDALGRIDLGVYGWNVKTLS
ncbi:MAG TPA: MGMT family protein [Gemmatimonadaceae bacterium]|nr:MGMT family protein [Gemmatimonadaceae bacterium]